MNFASTTRNASPLHILSRVLLGIEAIFLLLPLSLLIPFLALTFFGIAVPVGLVNSFHGETPLNAFVIPTMVLSAFACLAYWVTVATLTLGYIFQGRPSLAKTSQWQWKILLLGAGVSFAWFEISIAVGERSMGPWAMGELFGLGVFFLQLTAHLLIANWIAVKRGLI